MATFVRHALARREEDENTYTWDTSNRDDDDVYWWYSREGYIVKWTILAVIVLAFTLWIVGGYWHAKKRIQKGLRPLAYHRCFVSRNMMAQVDPRYAYPPPNTYYYAPPNGYYGAQQGGYPMQNMPPPPVYDPSRPPVYEEPPNGAKMDPSQGQQQRGVDGPADYYAPPAGPPPPR